MRLGPNLTAATSQSYYQHNFISQIRAEEQSKALLHTYAGHDRRHEWAVGDLISPSSWGGRRPGHTSTHSALARVCLLTCLLIHVGSDSTWNETNEQPERESYVEHV